MKSGGRVTCWRAAVAAALLLCLRLLPRLLSCLGDQRLDARHQLGFHRVQQVQICSQNS